MDISSTGRDVDRIRMKETSQIILFQFFLLFISQGINAQPNLSGNFSFEELNITVSQLFEHIEKNSDYKFSYNPSKIPTDKDLILPSNEMKMQEIISLLKKSGIGLSKRGDHVIVKHIEIPEPIEEKHFFTLRGYIKDKENDESLIGASVAIRSKGKGTISNGYGFYSLHLEQGVYDLTYSFIGYKPINKKVDLHANQLLNINLEKQEQKIEEVTIVVDESEQRYRSLHKGKSSFSVNELKNMPGMTGSPDVIKSLQSIPGINFYSDGSTIFHVRGGARDQNLLLIDEAPVYNPAHMLGIFSVFSPDALNSVEIYRGDMPAVYGGRLSSVIDIKTIEGNSEQLSFNGNTGPVTTALNLEGPLLRKKGSFFVSGRRSHLKWLLGRDSESIEQLYFSDFNLKANYRFNPNNRIFLSFYSGIDRFKNREARLRSSGISWTNFAGNLRWNHVFGDRLFSNTSLIASNYDYNLYTSYQLNQRWNAGISLLALKSDFSFYINPSHTLKYGIYLGAHSYFPGHYLSGDDPDPLRPGVPNKYARENAFYISYDLKLSRIIDVRTGIRFGTWNNIGATTEFVYGENNEVSDTLNYGDKEAYNRFSFFEPRVNLGFNFSKTWKAKLAYSRNTQFEFLISNSISPFTSLEVWLPAGPNVKPMFSDQLTAGLSFFPQVLNFNINAEVFYKKISNYMSYEDHADMIFNPNVETELRYGQARAYGAELVLKTSMERWEGWITYAWTRSLLRIQDINNLKEFPAGYDRPHSLNIFAEYDITQRWNVSASWFYASGSPFTSPTGYYYYLDHQVPYYLQRNNDRLPEYHRLDIATSIRLNQLEAKNQHVLLLSVFNLYGRKNPFNINFNKMLDGNGNIVVPKDYSSIPELEKTMMYLFGAVPSISYQFEF